MVPPAEERSPRPLKHTIVIWLVLLCALVGAFAATVLALNATLYSAGGFVGSYLSALERHDVDEALRTPGVLGVSDASRELLTPAALGKLNDGRLLSDDDMGDGFHVVTFEYRLDGTLLQSAFQVQHTGTELGFFSRWAFAQSPVGVLQVLPLHDAAFEVNGVKLRSEGGPDVVASYQVLTPGRFQVTHHSDFLTAEPVVIAVTQGSSVVPVELDIQANSAFVAKMQEQVDGFLDECTTSTVLFPTDCPFGQELSNRVEGTPKWSMARYPAITIEPGNLPGTWVIPDAQGAAHLKVDVRSLFDGTLSTFDQDVQFALRWVISFDGDKVDIQAE